MCEDGKDELPLVESLTSKATTAGVITRRQSPWGLARISHKNRLNLKTFTEYMYDSTAGGGTNVYVLDSGISTDHDDFEGRATWGTTILEGQDSTDSNGDGTFCAGIIASRNYGVAKSAKVIAVKTLDGDLNVNVSASVAGVKWALADHQSNVAANITTPGISLGSVIFLNPGINALTVTDESDSLNQAINAAVEAGVNVVVPAGNNGTDACSSIAQSKALIVGASGLDDSMPFFSNSGPCISLFAPGLSIKSAYIDGRRSVNTLSGTEMAAAHVAGLLAYFLALQPAADPKSTLLEIATRGALLNLPDGTPNVGFYCVNDNRARAYSLRFLLTTEAPRLILRV